MEELTFVVAQYVIGPKLSIFLGAFEGISFREYIIISI